MKYVITFGNSKLLRKLFFSFFFMMSESIPAPYETASKAFSYELVKRLYGFLMFVDLTLT